jgi:hypothetical protein
METYNLEALKEFEVKEVVAPVVDTTIEQEQEQQEEQNVVETKPTIGQQIQQDNTDDTPDPYNYFVEQLGIEGFEVTDDLRNKKFEGLVDIAKHQILKVQSELEDFKANKELVEYREHLAQGGTLETFRQVVNLVNEYESVEVTDENVEDLAKYFLKEVQGIEDEEEVQSLIDSKKDKGTLSDFVEKRLVTAKTNREREIESERVSIKEATANQQKEQQDYFKSIETAFEKVDVPKEILNEVKKLSLPDKLGAVPMYDIYNAMTPEQTVLMNTFAYQLNKGLPIEYKPIGTKKPNNVAANLLDKVAGKSQVVDKSIMTLDDIKNFANKR